MYLLSGCALRGYITGKQILGDYRLKIDEILKFGGAVTCNGVKLDVPGKAYYIFVVNYISVSRRPISEGSGKSARIVSKLFSL